MSHLSCDHGNMWVFFGKLSELFWGRSSGAFFFWPSEKMVGFLWVPFKPTPSGRVNEAQHAMKALLFQDHERTTGLPSDPPLKVELLAG